MADPVAVPTPKLAPATSPTGTPLVKPAAVPWLAIAIPVLLGALAALQHAPVGQGVKDVVSLVVTILTALAGVLSPGARKSDGAA